MPLHANTNRRSNTKTKTRAAAKSANTRRQRHRSLRRSSKSKSNHKHKPHTRRNQSKRRRRRQVGGNSDQTCAYNTNYAPYNYDNYDRMRGNTGDSVAFSGASVPANPGQTLSNFYDGKSTLFAPGHSNPTNQNQVRYLSSTGPTDPIHVGSLRSRTVSLPTATASGLNLSLFPTRASGGSAFGSAPSSASRSIPLARAGGRRRSTASLRRCHHRRRRSRHQRGGVGGELATGVIVRLMDSTELVTVPLTDGKITFGQILDALKQPSKKIGHPLIHMRLLLKFEGEDLIDSGFNAGRYWTADFLEKPIDLTLRDNNASTKNELYVACVICNFAEFENTAKLKEAIKIMGGVDNDDAKIEITDTYGSVPEWLTGKITDMSSLFKEWPEFNEDISMWDVSKVENMSSMFSGCTQFNKDLNEWVVSKVENMSRMFLGCAQFNKDLNQWDVSKVTLMVGMFMGATAFNGDICNWTLPLVINTMSMFKDATHFNRDIGGWGMCKIKNVVRMFRNATSFVHSLTGWLEGIRKDSHDVIGLGKDMFEGTLRCNDNWKAEIKETLD
jgi:surface protein